MPRAGDILDGLSAIANQATGVAIAWHMLIATALVALGRGWRPAPRTARLLIGIPLASVAVLAVAFANPFNGLVFTASVLAMTALAIRRDRRPVWRGSAWTRALGLLMIAFAWVYPHFLEGPAIDYLYAAPVGLVPCPTLAVAIGFALLGNGVGSRPWALTLAAIGLSYGLFGVLRLGVFLDIPLVVGAIALVVALPSRACRTTGGQTDQSSDAQPHTMAGSGDHSLRAWPFVVRSQRVNRAPGFAGRMRATESGPDSRRQAASGPSRSA